MSSDPLPHKCDFKVLISGEKGFKVQNTKVFNNAFGVTLRPHARS